MVEKKKASEAIAHELADEVLHNIAKDLQDIPIGELLEGLIKRSVHNIIHSTYNTTATVRQSPENGFRKGMEKVRQNETKEGGNASDWYNKYQEELLAKK